jgi:hypothetical protein
LIPSERIQKRAEKRAVLSGALEALEEKKKLAEKAVQEQKQLHELESSSSDVEVDGALIARPKEGGLISRKRVRVGADTVTVTVENLNARLDEEYDSADVGDE